MSRVAVLLGGLSAERQVSLASGQAIAEALRRLGHEVVEIDVDRDLAARLAEAEPDVVFNGLHGRYGEDGTVQGLLELIGLPYTHSGVAASAMAMNKRIAKTLFAAAGLPLADDLVIDREALFEVDPMPRPYVVKPIDEGSSVGVVIVEEGGNLGNPVSKDAPGPWSEFEELMIEKYIPGRELSVAVLGDEAYGVVELKPTRGFYDYDAKYTEGLTRHLMPAPVPQSIYDAAQDMALTAHRALGCRGVTRSDFRYDDTENDPGRLVLLEINTQPGMTPLSLVPEIVADSGMEFDTLIAEILADAGTAK